MTEDSKDTDSLMRVESIDRPYPMRMDPAMRPTWAMALLVGHGWKDHGHPGQGHPRKSGLDLNYSGMKKYVLTSPASPDAQLADICKDVSDPKFAWDEPKYGKTMGSALSIGIDGSAYVIIVLHPEICARYRTGTVPFMSGTAAAQARHYNPRLFADGRLLGAGQVLTSQSPECRTAMFTVDHAGLSGAVSVMPFNIYLEVPGNTHDGKPYVTPIIIDPDTRYPPTEGGTGV